MIASPVMPKDGRRANNNRAGDKRQKAPSEMGEFSKGRDDGVEEGQGRGFGKKN